MIKINLFGEVNKYINDKNVSAICANEIMRWSDDYAPFDTGVVKNTAKVIQNGKDAIIQYGDTPYTHYVWVGKLYVDQITKKGAFYSPTFGFWSRPNVQKIPSDRYLNFRGAPKRGSQWVYRCWNENKEQILQGIKL